MTFKFQCSKMFAGAPSIDLKEGLMFQNRIQDEKDNSLNEEQSNNEEKEKTNNTGNEINSADKIEYHDLRPKMKVSRPIPLKNYATGQTFYDTLHASSAADEVRALQIINTDHYSL